MRPRRRIAYSAASKSPRYKTVRRLQPQRVAEFTARINELLAGHSSPYGRKVPL